jgi:UDP-N-acetylglucosamine diphosphorylase / glucose-1-phosphate thymidylyltransferase / UDP-N-acetylgalactosamine diphosphorylase / glucosamine-1-phosphate N-acetyltransferase / galactosamine-1-phosphate N-acetyltransferase
MRLCIYEDSGVPWLEPIALTRPAFALWCGAERLFERQRRQFGATELGFWIRPILLEMWKLDQPHHPVNDADWLRERSTVWINGRWLPAPDVQIDATVPHVGNMNGQTAYAVLPSGESPGAEEFDAWLGAWKDRLPMRAVSGAMLGYLWDIIDQNGAALKQDGARFRAEHGSRPIPPHIAITGPAEQFVVAEDAVVEPFVFADTRGGPVLIDRGAIVHSFSRLEGPCYVGTESWIVGAKLRANSTIGPRCRIGGEIEASIVQGFSNKYHDGFLGHSFLGEWVNLAAATQTSDLRNDYDTVRVSVNGQRLQTGRGKVGSYIGDHAKTGLAALLNTGSTIGAFASILPAGMLLPQVVPSFCQVQQGQIQELSDLRKAFSTAARVMQRRGKTLTDAHENFYYDLFEATAERRNQTIRESEMRYLRRSV